MTLLVTTGLFVLGLLSDWIFGRPALFGGRSCGGDPADEHGDDDVAAGDGLAAL